MELSIKFRRIWFRKYRTGYGENCRGFRDERAGLQSVGKGPALWLPVGISGGVIPESDVLSLHCPLTPETTGLVNRDTLGPDEAHRLFD